MLRHLSSVLAPVARFGLLASTLAAAGCSDGVEVNVSSGVRTFEVSLEDLMLPEQLRDESSGEARIASVSCEPLCPSTAEVAFECNGGICDPAPLNLVVPVGDVIDFQALISQATLVRFVDAIIIRSVEYGVASNTLNVDLPDTEIFWAPEGAATVDPATGARLLGTMGSVAAGTDVSGGQLQIDNTGAQLLSDYVLGTSSRIRFFARTRPNLDPGQPFPAGGATVSINMQLRIVGRLVR